MTQQIDALEEKPEPPEPENVGVSDAPDAPAKGAAARASSAPTLWARRVLGTVWRTRGLWLGALAIGCVLYGQKVLVERVPTDPAPFIKYSTRWYAAGILLMFAAWAGTYKNRLMLRLPALKEVVSGQMTTDDGRWTMDDGRPSVSELSEGVDDEPQTTGDASPKSKVHRPKSSIVHRLSSVVRRPSSIVISRYLLAFAALGLNLYSVGVLRTSWSSLLGGLGWLASLLLLLFAFIGYRPKVGPDADEGVEDVEDKTDWRMPRKIEILIVLAIFALAAFMRLYHLDDWTTGMHGDEGEAGMDAINILEGHPVSPFEVGWFAQPNFYYWAIAIGMKIFGADLGGLRSFSAICGLLMFLPFYPMVRQWFGVRTALIATVFMAISDVTLHFTRAQFSNVTTPMLLAAGFYFLFRGLRDIRVLNFVLAGYSFSFGLYFYNGGRLSPVMLAGAVVYLFLLMPLLRLPGVYKETRRSMLGVKRLNALGKAAWTQVRGVANYAGQILMLAIATFCMATPWYFYSQDHNDSMGARVNEKVIFYNAQRMSDQYGDLSGPLYLGLRMPTADDIYPVLPVAFEQTAQSVEIARDGFWPRALWNQLTTTLSVITIRVESSGVYGFPGEPIAKPIEAALIALGVAWALWRWRDTRMAMLSIWFWGTIIAGGVMTIDAPYMARLVGMLPTLAIFAALPVSKLVAEFVSVASRQSPVASGQSANRWRLATGDWRLILSGAAVVALLGYLTWQNFYDYYTRYLNPYPFSQTTGYAVAVRQMNNKIVSQGRPKPKFYSLGAPTISWDYGVNRFLNHSLNGVDIVNFSNALPLRDKGNQDVVFVVWDSQGAYLSALYMYYPNGETTLFHYSPDGQSNYLLTMYRVRNEELHALRFSQASYTAKGSNPIVRREDGLGTTNSPPGGLTYPVEAEWTSKVVAPQFATYRFQLSGTTNGSLVIDGLKVLTITAQTDDPSAEVILAKGVHDVRLAGTMQAPTDAIELLWTSGPSQLAPIANEYLWEGVDSGFAVEVRPFGAGADMSQDPPPDVPGGGNPPVIQRRIDSFVGFRDIHTTLSGGTPMMAEWKGVLNIAASGEYGFSVYESSVFQLLIDGRRVMGTDQINQDGAVVTSTVHLDVGTHDFVLRYNWIEGNGILDLYWTPPGWQERLVTAQVVRTPSNTGAWTPGSVSDPPFYQMPTGDEQVTSHEIRPDMVIENEGVLARPRGLVIDSKGNLYVADWGNNRIVVYSPDGKLLHTWGSEPADENAQPQPGEFLSITDVALQGDDTLYAVDSKGGILQVLDTTDPQGKVKRVIDISHLGMYSPNGLTVGSDGSLYLADTGQGRILKLAPNYDGGSPPQVFDGTIGKIGESRPNSKLKEPVDVAVGDSGGEDAVYGLDLNNRVVRFSQDGRTTNQWGVEVGATEGGSKTALSQDGKTLYVTDPDLRQIAVLDLVKGGVRYYKGVGDGSGQLAQPSGIAVGPDGRVYVVDNAQNNIKVYTFGK